MDLRRSRFLDLPAELRNRNYEQVLESEKHVPALHIDDDNPEHWFPFPITRVSQQVRHETLGMLYGG